MTDLIFIGLILMFFALSFGMIGVCEHLMEDRP
jgi:hypothetical protein